MYSYKFLLLSFENYCDLFGNKLTNYKSEYDFKKIELILTNN